MIHPGDDELSLYTIGRELLDSPDSVEAHLAECASCSALLEDHERFDESLRSSETWRVAGTDTHRESLIAMAIQMQREDEQADHVLAPFFAKQEGVAWGELVRDPKFRTGGVVRRLCEVSHDVCPRVPEEGLALSKAASAISMALPDDLYPARALSVLRGIAWKEQSNAFRLLDRFREALEALSRADDCFAELVTPELDFAIVGYTRSSALFESDDLDGAEEAAEKTSALFRHLGQEARARSVGVVLGGVFWRRGDFARAIKVFEQILFSPEHASDPSWVSTVRANLGWCHLDAGDPRTAADLFREGRAGFVELGFASDVTRCDWGLALVSRDLGNHREALAQLLAVSAAFAEQQVVVDSATAMVEAFEIMLALGETDGIERLAAGLVETLTGAGKMESALTALAYIKEAAAGKSITPEILRAARTFLRRADRHPELIFVPPPFF
jgi:tetratricopeptide (TPR) repeat protein